MDNLAEKIVKLLDDKKAEDIKILNIEELTSIADCFVIASGGSNVQVKALCDHVEEELRKKNIFPKHTEGYRNASWILLDYGSVIVHIFNRETREFYKIENLWTDPGQKPQNDTDSDIE